MEDIDVLLAAYEPGRPEYKPEVLKQIEDMTADRKRRIEEHNSVPRSEYERMKANFEKVIQGKDVLIGELFRQHKEMKDKLLKFNSSNSSSNCSSNCSSNYNT